MKKLKTERETSSYSLNKKSEALCASLRLMGRALVMYSGGVDSALVAYLAHSALGADSAAITVDSPLTTSSDRRDAPEIAEIIGIKHYYIKANELTNADFVQNGPRRCYHCKKLRLRFVVDWAQQHGYEHILDGSNADDQGDYRPGFDALRECAAVKSPLLEFGFTKSDVRALLREAGFDVWQKPSGACLASRIASGLPIDIESLSKIDRAESYIKELLPPHSQLRVRHHGDIARIETELNCSKTLLAAAEKVCEVLRTIGYRYVTLDLAGYSVGSCTEGVYNSRRRDKDE